MVCGKNGTELKKLVSKGNIVYIKHSSMYEPILSVIQNVDERALYLSVPAGFINSNVAKGDNIRCQLLEGDYEYVINGTLYDVEVKHQCVLIVFIEKVSKYKNNRQFKRYPVSFQSEVIIAGLNVSTNGITKNLSIIGVAVVLNRQISKDTIVTLKVDTFISRDERLEFKARIIRVVKNGNDYEYGMEIIDISDKNKVMLDKVIFCLNTNENTFIEDLLK